MYRAGPSPHGATISKETSVVYTKTVVILFNYRISLTFPTVESNVSFDLLWFSSNSEVKSVKLFSCSSSKVPSAVSPGSILHTSQDVPPPVTPTHHLWSLWPGPQTWLLLHSLCPEKVAPCAHTSLGLPERPPEAPTTPLFALLGCLSWG